jgi:predicted ATP-grasp superfamily ATP-dependent carboligase
MRILITDNDSRSALAATRSLGREGHTVITAGERHALADASRYSSGFVSYPPPTSDGDGFVAAVVEATRSERIDVVLPMAEVTTMLLTENRALLGGECKLPFADYRTIELASNKRGITALAQELGVPVPHTLVVNDAAQARAHLDGMQFPVVIKPARSRVRTDSGWRSGRVSYAHDRRSLEQALETLDRALFPVLLQERIAGTGVGFFACYDHGRLVAHFAHRRLRERPPSGGVSVLSESTAVDPAAFRHGTRLLEHLRWHGVAMVEFRRDERDGSLRLMEINARFWGSLQLAILAGVNFPAILVRLAAGAPVEPIRDYRLGVRCRWFLGDLDSLLLVLLRSRARLSLPPGFPSRWNTLRQFLHLCGSDLHYEILTREDPRPGWLELCRWLLPR